MLNNVEHSHEYIKRYILGWIFNNVEHSHIIKRYIPRVDYVTMFNIHT